MFSNLQTEFPQGSINPKSNSFWRPVPYEFAFKGTPYYREDLADKGYKILQHWAASDRTQADDYPNGRYFVIEYNNFTSEWILP